MASRGKSINVFLMDGEASGRIKCTLANWTGVAYKITLQCETLDKILLMIVFPIPFPWNSGRTAQSYIAA